MQRVKARLRQSNRPLQMLQEKGRGGSLPVAVERCGDTRKLSACNCGELYYLSIIECDLHT